MKQLKNWMSVAIVLASVAASRSAPQRAPRPAPVAKRPPASTQPTSEVAKAQAELQQVEKRLWAAFEQTDDYQKADAALKAAQADFEAAEKAAVEQIKGKPEYQAALDAEQKVEEEQVTARTAEAGGATIDPTLATRAMDARMAVHKLESDAGDNDPAAKAAKEKVQTARQAVNALRSKYDATLRADPEYVAARKALDTARAQARHT